MSNNLVFIHRTNNISLFSRNIIIIIIIITIIIIVLFVVVVVKLYKNITITRYFKKKKEN